MLKTKQKNTLAKKHAFLPRHHFFDVKQVYPPDQISFLRLKCWVATSELTEILRKSCKATPADILAPNANCSVSLDNHLFPLSFGLHCFIRKWNCLARWFFSSLDETPASTTCQPLLSHKKDLTFFVKPPDDVVNVVRKEAPWVEDCGQHCCNSPRGHGLVIGMLVHLRFLTKTGM